jgi:hypothetical protein
MCLVGFTTLNKIAYCDEIEVDYVIDTDIDRIYSYQ